MVIMVIVIFISRGGPADGQVLGTTADLCLDGVVAARAVWRGLRGDGGYCEQPLPAPLPTGTGKSPFSVAMRGDEPVARLPQCQLLPAWGGGDMMAPATLWWPELRQCDSA